MSLPFSYSVTNPNSPIFRLNENNGVRIIHSWRRERDSNPRGIAPKLISSQPRYDHFDISLYEILMFAILRENCEMRFYESAFERPETSIKSRVFESYEG